MSWTDGKDRRYFGSDSWTQRALGRDVGCSAVKDRI